LNALLFVEIFLVAITIFVNFWRRKWSLEPIHMHRTRFEVDFGCMALFNTV
jgi:hypothetical protein